MLGLFCFDRGFTLNSVQHRMYLAMLAEKARHEDAVYCDHRIKREKYTASNHETRKHLLTLHTKFFNMLADPLTNGHFAVTMEDVAIYYNVSMPQ